MPQSHEELAAQLRCPQAEAGTVLGQEMNLRNLPMILGALDQLDIRDRDKILEPGCGNGGLLGYILSQAKDVHYTGLEISTTMVAAARAFNAAFIAAGMADYLLLSDTSSDDTDLPFAEAVFDRILSVNTIYFQTNLTTWLAELCRVLKPSGRLCLTFSERDFMQKLPFTTHGFHLFDAHEVEAATAPLPVRKVASVAQRDITVSKSGTLVERPFVHLVFERIDR